MGYGAQFCLILISRVRTAMKAGLLIHRECVSISIDLSTPDSS